MKILIQYLDIEEVYRKKFDSPLSELFDDEECFYNYFIIALQSKNLKEKIHAILSLLRMAYNNGKRSSENGN